MTEMQLLLYFPDPYSVGKSRYAVATPSDMHLITAEEARGCSAPVTYEAGTLIDDLRRNGVAPPADLADMSDAIRLLTGISKADGGERKWDFWKTIRPFFNSESDWQLSRDIHRARALIPDDERVIQLFSAMTHAGYKLWERLSRDLVERNELERFNKVERPVAQIFYYRQFHGIAIDTGKLETFSRFATEAKYRSYRQVAEALKTSPTGLTYWNLGSLIERTDFHSDDEVRGYVLRDQMKIAKPVSTFAEAFTEYQDVKRDLEVLSRLNETGGRVFPSFHSLGTISSRILVSDPYLQELRRRYRSVISADPGMSLAYFDYAQFEPGIMAAISGDDEFLKLYNEGDIYLALSKHLHGDDEHRDICKRIFLAFSYGMTTAGISKLLLPKHASDDERRKVEAQIDAFFNKFATLVKYKRDLESELERNGYVETLIGNRRIRTGDGKLNPRERRWALSQVVQGNASLIFKTALIRIAEEFGSEAILLPVHDAVLMQFPENETLNENLSRVTEVMRESFVSFCPGVNARVKMSAFAD